MFLNSIDFKLITLLKCKHLGWFLVEYSHVKFQEYPCIKSWSVRQTDMHT
jgi:hypothetical protein